MLSKTMRADFILFRQGVEEDKNWPGRVLSYLTMGYLFMNAKDYPGALKFLYDA